MNSLQPPIGILGGTFDPIHMGHLRMAIELQDALGLSHVHIIPCQQPVHRKLPSASAEQRLAMVQCAVANEPTLIADDREIRRKGPSYMIDTLLDMRAEMPNTPLCLILGIDSYLGFASWHRYNDILELAHLIIAHRPQYQLPKSGIIADMVKHKRQTDPAFIHQHLAGGMMLWPITALDISATDIRKQIAMGKNPRYLLPDSVYQYIKQHDVYNLGRI